MARTDSQPSPSPGPAGGHGIFLSWAPFSRRTQTLAERFDLAACQVPAPGFKRPWYAPLKYPLQSWRTRQEFARLGAGEVWVMDPPLPAVAAGWMATRRWDTRLVVDIHTVGFYARSWRAVRPFELPFLRAADAVVVTNRELARRVRGWGCRAYVLPDPLPDPPQAALAAAVEPDLVTIVATYSEDEPIDVLPEVASRLGDARIHVTGRPRVATDAWPANLVPTGFLEDDDYWMQLGRSAVVVVLTTRPNTLLSGGYEALSLGRPLVVSDHEVLREYYADAAAYVDSTAASIAEGIAAALGDVEAFAAGMRALAARRAADWDRSAAALRGDLRDPVTIR